MTWPSTSASSPVATAAWVSVGGAVLFVCLSVAVLCYCVEDNFFTFLDSEKDLPLPEI